ncbi:(d)CMP kinase [Entomospira culicis]|uniref:Cytidylate kinase n=1 Tax=Entomospira culicis TaxID=2719989 RepID=A0A968GEV6_9SPIO|nr:(d)CMP kinase [Entomospira culicis]NIZ18527.1 (d)CMP kinase [Entomospira culicis]NIZ68743.1 (d)CMP kinase [Entomospira culicis]WDI37339.1 (d)CMP kinase [Entomospira culicis]WDI38968.1 (d)CMP kinase [Entomospira culicis]
MIVAIDGPAGGGKSALAKLIAERMDFFLLNSGYFYRAVTLYGLRAQSMDEGAWITIAQSIDFSIADGALLVNGVALSGDLHSDVIDAWVPKVSSVVAVRTILNEKMRSLVANRDVVCEGRDMTSVVFPDAQLKIYLDASVEIRAKRRFQQEYSTLSLDEIQKSIQNRDEIDRTKSVGALQIVPEAWYIDSSDKSLEDVYAMIQTKIADIRV